MRTRTRTLATVVAVTTATMLAASTAMAGPAPTKQRVAITARAGINGFSLAPFKPGRLSPDTGTAVWCSWSERIVTREGQRIEINSPLSTLNGKRGTLVLRWRIEWLDAGNGYTIGASTGRSCAEPAPTKALPGADAERRPGSLEGL